MSKRRDEVAQPLDEIVSAQQVMDELVAETVRLVEIKAAKQELAELEAVLLRWAVAYRRAVMEVGA